MPKLTADMETAERMSAIPKGIYSAHIKAEDSELSKKTQAPMIKLQFVIDEGVHAGREMPGMGGWYYIMAGGIKEDGSPHDTSRLLDTIGDLGAEWECAQCGVRTTKRLQMEIINGKKHYICPSCGKRAKAKVDGSWLGLACKIGVDLEKMQNSDEDRNVVKRTYPRNYTSGGTN